MKHGQQYEQTGRKLQVEMQQWSCMYISKIAAIVAWNQGMLSGTSFQRGNKIRLESHKHFQPHADVRQGSASLEEPDTKAESIHVCWRFAYSSPE